MQLRHGDAKPAGALSCTTLALYNDLANKRAPHVDGAMVHQVDGAIAGEASFPERARFDEARAIDDDGTLLGPARFEVREFLFRGDERLGFAIGLAAQGPRAFRCHQVLVGRRFLRGNARSCPIIWRGDGHGTQVVR